MGKSQELDIKSFKKQDRLSSVMNNYQYELLSYHLNCFLRLEFYTNDKKVTRNFVRAVTVYKNDPVL